MAKYPSHVFNKKIARETFAVDKFVPKEKMSKKAQKELNRQRRVKWDLSPITRTADSRKLYNRKRNARNRYDDSTSISFVS